MTTDSSGKFRRIATEQAFSTPKITAALERLVGRTGLPHPAVNAQPVRDALRMPH
jgi:hypothetical protein